MRVRLHVKDEKTMVASCRDVGALSEPREFASSASRSGGSASIPAAWPRAMRRSASVEEVGGVVEVPEEEAGIIAIAGGACYVLRTLLCVFREVWRLELEVNLEGGFGGAGALGWV